MSDDRKVVDLDARRPETVGLRPVDAVAHIRATIERINKRPHAFAANDEVREIRTLIAKTGHP